MNAHQKLHQLRLQEWIPRFSEQQASGLTIREWCKENDISIHQYNYWKRCLKEEVASQALPDIAPLMIPVSSMQTQEFSSACFSYGSPSGKIKFSVNGLSFELDPFVPEDFLVTLLRAVRHA